MSRRRFTFELDDQLLRRAQERATDMGISVDDFLARELARCASEWSDGPGWAKLLELARRSTAGSGPGGRDWRREDLYDV